MTSNKEWEDEVMTIEDKAQAYDEVLNKLRHFIAQGVDPLITRADVQDFFPGLVVESEDEKIRKDLIAVFKGQIPFTSEKDAKRYIAWLEKQGEQKPNPYTGTSFEYNGHNWGMCARDNGIEILFDGELKAFLSSEKSFIYPIHPQPYLAPKSASKAIKEKKVDNQNCIKSIDNVKPKFKVGDWVVDSCGYALKIEGILNQFYILKGVEGSESRSTIEWANKNFHLWTIQDAKDGDVLYLQKDGKEHIIIYKGVIKERFRTFVSAYCAYNGIVEDFCFADVSRYTDITYGGIMPATKEQRDQLEKAMINAGYEWNAEKKELKKIENASNNESQKLGEFINELSKQFPDVSFAKLSRIAVRVAKWAKPTDEEMKELFRTEYEKGRADAIAEMQKSTWSEEDETIALSIEQVINCASLLNIVPEKVDKIRTWLKSLKDRCTWKPSKEQLDALKRIQTGVIQFSVLQNLYNDLKKL